MRMANLNFLQLAMIARFSPPRRPSLTTRQKTPFIGNVLRLIVLSGWVLVCCPAPAQTPQPAETATIRTTQANPTFGPLDLLTRPDVQQELELLDDQLLQLHQFRVEVETARRDRLENLLQQVRSGANPPGSLSNALREELINSDEQVAARLRSILLPHQARRLAQIQLQLQLRQGGLVGPQSSSWLTQLDLSAEQRLAIREAAERSEREWRRQMAESRLTLQRDILRLLTPLQKQRLQDLVGKPFQFQDQLTPRTGGSPTPAKTPPPLPQTPP